MNLKIHMIYIVKRWKERVNIPCPMNNSDHITIHQIQTAFICDERPQIYATVGHYRLPYSSRMYI